MGYSKNVFINCPFDDDYLPLLRPLLFTVVYLEFEPRISLESLDSGRPRVQKIVSLIRASKYGIHDISRLKAKKAGELFRLNMPFELGIDVGCRSYKGGKWAKKKCLILESERYRFQAAISDLSNSDILVHNDEPKRVVTAVRNWLNNQAKLTADGPSRIWGAFNEFMADNFVALKGKGFSKTDIKNLPVDELLKNMKAWVAKRSA